MTHSSSPLGLYRAPVFVARREAKTFFERRSRECVPFSRAGSGSPFRVTFSDMEHVQGDGRVFFSTASVVTFGEAR